MTTPRLFRTLFQRASAAFTGSGGGGSGCGSGSGSGSRFHRWNHAQVRNPHYPSQHTHIPNIQPPYQSFWAQITFRSIMAFTAAVRPFKPQIITTRCYSKRLEDSPFSSCSPSPSASPHSGPFRRWSPMLGLIPVAFYASSNSSDDDDKMMTCASNSPSMTSHTSSPSIIRGRTGSSPLDFVRMRLKDMEPEEEDMSPTETSPIIPIRGYDKSSNIWSRHGSSSKIATLQFELEEEEEIIPPSHTTPITPPLSKSVPTSTSSSSDLSSRVDSDGHLVVRAADVRTTLSWQSLASFLSQSSHVTSLRLQGMSLLPSHVEILGSGTLRHIRNLTLVDNNLGVKMDTLTSLVPLLRTYPQLESLSLIRQSLNDEHVALIAPAITTQTCLTHVSLAWNGIGDEGAKRLSLVLRQTTNMSKVDLSYNTIGRRGGDALSLIQQQLQRTGRNLSINLKHQQSRERSIPWTTMSGGTGTGTGTGTGPGTGPGIMSHRRHSSAAQSALSFGSLTASDMLGVMASDITTSMIPRSQPIAIPTPSTSTSTSSFERHIMSSMAFH